MVMQERKAAKLANKGKPKPIKGKPSATEQNEQEPSEAAVAPATVTQSRTDDAHAQSSADLSSQLDGHPTEDSSSHPSSHPSPHPAGSCEAAAVATQVQQQPQQEEETQQVQQGQRAVASASALDQGGATEFGAGLSASDASAEPAGHDAPAGHAEHAEPRDVLLEFAALSPQLPDMPKVDYSNDLPGLFRAAFATCNEMSPRKAGSLRSAAADQTENLTLYDDAEEALHEEDR